MNMKWISIKIYNCLCNQCLVPLMRVWILIRARCTTLCDKVCQWLATGRWFSPGPPVSFTNKTDCHDITEILLKVALNTIKQNKLKIFIFPCSLISHLQYRNEIWFNLANWFWFSKRYIFINQPNLHSTKNQQRSKFQRNTMLICNRNIYYKPSV